MIFVILGIFVVFFAVALGIATYANAQLQDTFEKYNHVPCNKKITGGQFALHITNTLFESRIQVGRTKGYLNDGYSSKSKMVVLSEATCDVASVAALTVVAHEFGHASQDLTNSKKLRLNKSLTRTIKVLGYFMFPLAVLGIFFLLVFPEILAIGFAFLGASILIFLLAVALKLSCVPLEKDASKRGLKIIEKTQALDDDELEMAKDLLHAAFLTYVGDFLRSILWWTFLTRKTKMF